jgi:SAM-dependent MidA family methyltransferase
VVSRSQEDLGAIRGIVFSNELVDAMPVHRVRLRNGQMEEQYVGVSAEPGSGPRLSLVWGQPSTSRLEEYIAKLGAPLAEGQTAEINLDAIDWLSDIAGRIERGFLITVDYGDTVCLLWSAGRRDGTLRCFHRHRLIDSPLNSPGEQDLTSSVNFTALIEYGRGFGLARAGYYRQSEFLIDKGLLERIARMDELKARLAAKNLLVPGGTSDNFRVLVQKRVNTGQAG